MKNWYHSIFLFLFTKLIVRHFLERKLFIIIYKQERKFYQYNSHICPFARFWKAVIILVSNFFSLVIFLKLLLYTFHYVCFTIRYLDYVAADTILTLCDSKCCKICNILKCYYYKQVLSLLFFTLPFFLDNY